MGQWLLRIAGYALAGLAVPVGSKWPGVGEAMAVAGAGLLHAARRPRAIAQLMPPPK